MSETIKLVKIGPGEHYVTSRPDELIVTVLGSCVAACVRDPLARVGGMNHFMLPESSTGTWGQVSANMRYGNFAMERLVNDILRRGGQRSRLEIKVFGGAAMLGTGAPIGDQNADFVETYLKAENMPIAAQHLRGSHARRIKYAPITGKAMMMELKEDDGSVTRAESHFLKTVKNVPDGGSVELFD